MRKKDFRRVLAGGIICAMTFSSTAVFADTASEVEAEVSENTPTGQVINLSLADAYKKLDSSISMEMLLLQKDSDSAVARGYTENIKSLNKMEDNEKYYWVYDDSSKEMLKTMRDFANSVLEPNHTARVNALKRDTFEQYYTLKNLEEQVAIANESVAINEKLYSDTKLKYQVGKASNIELLNAESSLNAARDTYKAALDGLNTMKMSFNISMDYPLMQNVKFTDEITEVKLPATTLEKAIENAAANRLEIKEAAYNLEMANLNMDNVKAYAKNTSTYMNAKTGLLGAQLANATAPKKVEMDVRMKYADMNTAYEKVQTCKKDVETSAETAKIARLQYETGLATITTVQQANLGLYSAKLAQANALLTYNLAVEDFELAQGVGTTAASLSGSK